MLHTAGHRPPTDVDPVWVDPVSVEQLGQLAPTFPWGVLLLNRWYKKDPTPVRRLTNTLQNPTRFARFSIEYVTGAPYCGTKLYEI